MTLLILVYLSIGVGLLVQAGQANRPGQFWAVIVMLLLGVYFWGEGISE